MFMPAISFLLCHLFDSTMAFLFVHHMFAGSKEDNQVRDLSCVQGLCRSISSSNHFQHYNKLRHYLLKVLLTSFVFCSFDSYLLQTKISLLRLLMCLSQIGPSFSVSLMTSPLRKVGTIFLFKSSVTPSLSFELLLQHQTILFLQRMSSLKQPKLMLLMRFLFLNPNPRYLQSSALETIVRSNVNCKYRPCCKLPLKVKIESYCHLN